MLDGLGVRAGNNEKENYEEKCQGEMLSSSQLEQRYCRMDTPNSLRF